MGSAVRIAHETTELVLVECWVGLRHPSIGPALLILAELVTNAVRHAAAVPPTITVTYAHRLGVFAVHGRHLYQSPLFGTLTRERPAADWSPWPKWPWTGRNRCDAWQRGRTR